MSEAAYRVVIHRRAKAELDALADEFDTEDLAERIHDAATRRQPKTHPCVEPLAGFDGYCKIQAVGVRAICDLAPPEFRVLLVDKRRVVYDRVETAIQRATDADGGAGDA